MVVFLAILHYCAAAGCCFTCYIMKEGPAGLCQSAVAAFLFGLQARTTGHSGKTAKSQASRRKWLAIGAYQHDQHSSVSTCSMPTSLGNVAITKAAAWDSQVFWLSQKTSNISPTHGHSQCSSPVTPPSLTRA